MYNFGELKIKVANMLQRSGDAAYATKIGDFINYAQDFAYREYDYYAELEDDYYFTTVDGQESYFMPSHFGIPLRIYDFTNTKKLAIWTRESYVDVNISTIADARTGAPDKAMLFGISPINGAIAVTGITLKVKSSSIADSNSPVVRVEGFIDAGMTVIDYEDITVSSGTPTTYNAASSPKTFYKITHITKSIDTTGYITVADSSGNVKAIIASTQRASRYPVVKLGVTPNDAFSMYTMFKRLPLKMVNDNDYPFIDADEFFISYGHAYGLSEEKESVERSAQIFARSKEILLGVIRNEQTRLGESFQHKMVPKNSTAHRV